MTFNDGNQMNQLPPTIPQAAQTCPVFQAWLNAKANKSTIEKHERECRQPVIEKYSSKESGAETLTVDGQKITITKSKNYKLENKNGETQLLAQSLPLELQMRLFRWKPELQAAEWKVVCQMAQQGDPFYIDLKRKLEDILTITDASVSVALVK